MLHWVIVVDDFGFYVVGLSVSSSIVLHFSRFFGGMGF